jgi:hypothetical protein
MTATTVIPEQDTQPEPMEQEYVNAYDPRHVDDYDSWDEETGHFKHRKPKEVQDTAMMARANNSDGNIVVVLYIISTIGDSRGVHGEGGFCDKTELIHERDPS